MEQLSNYQYDTSQTVAISDIWTCAYIVHIEVMYLSFLEIMRFAKLFFQLTLREKPHLQKIGFNASENELYEVSLD